MSRARARRWRGHPNLFQDPDYKLGSITHPDSGVRTRAVEHLVECVRIATALGSTGQSLWLADGTNYAGQGRPARAPPARSTASGPCTRSCHRSIAFANERRAGAPRLGGGSPAAAGLTDERRAALMRDILPALRGAVSSERHKVLTADRSPRTVEFVPSQEAPELVGVGAACPDHLVHTKRVPLWIPYAPGADDAATRIAERAAGYRDDYRASSRGGWRS